MNTFTKNHFPTIVPLQWNNRFPTDDDELHLSGKTNVIPNGTITIHAYCSADQHLGYIRLERLCILTAAEYQPTTVVVSKVALLLRGRQLLEIPLTGQRISPTAHQSLSKDTASYWESPLQLPQEGRLPKSIFGAQGISLGVYLPQVSFWWTDEGYYQLKRESPSMH